MSIFGAIEMPIFGGPAAASEAPVGRGATPNPVRLRQGPG